MDFLDRNEVLAAIHGFNPWWSKTAVPQPKFRRLAFISCWRYLTQAHFRRAILLSGPRRVGKTTILLQLANALVAKGNDPASVLYLSLDHPLIKLYTLPKILALYRQHIYAAGKPSTLLLDEVQYAKEWDLELKQIVDHQPENRIVATGSSSLLQRQKVAESGVGRWLTISVPTLSFYEFLQIRDQSPSDISQRLIPSSLFNAPPAELRPLAVAFRALEPLFRRYLLLGGFPETALLDEVTLCQRILREDVVERVLKRDMTSLFGIRNINDLEKLFIYLCLHSGGIFSAKGCATALETTQTTVVNHIQLLEQANLIYRLAPKAIGGKAILKARPKIYLVDAALRNAVLLRGEEIYNDSTQMGMIVETTVLRHLLAYYYRDVPRLSYWRDAATEKELDLIVESPKYEIPVEIKYREQAVLTHKDGAVAYCRERKIKRAYVISRLEMDFGTRQVRDCKTDFLYIPAHIFCYLIGQAERLLWE